MKQEERLEGLLLGRVGHALPRAVLSLDRLLGVAQVGVDGVGGALVVEGKDDLKRGGAHEARGEVVNADEGHGASLLWVSVTTQV